MLFLDLEGSVYLNGDFTADNAEAIGEFDKAHGYTGAICAIGEIGAAISFAGSIDALISSLAAVATNYAKGYPDGNWSFSFNNQGASSTTGEQAGQIQDALEDQVSATIPFLDAEPSYASPSDTVDMVNSFLAQYEVGLQSDIGYYEADGWNCTTLTSFISAIGGISQLMPQNYCDGDVSDYTDCSLSGFGGVTVWAEGAETPTCGDSSLGYQGGINNFASAFQECPTWGILNGGYANSIDASSLTCTA